MSPQSIEYRSILHLKAPEEVSREVLACARMACEDFNPSLFCWVFGDVVRLYNGEFPGRRACSTPYHDLVHVLDTVLATVRLIHGAMADGAEISGRGITLGLAAALLHDAGYLQDEGDFTGSGCKHTQVHVARSADFAREYLPELEFSQAEVEDVAAMILCTDLEQDPADLPFSCPESALLGRLLGTADIVGQMADDIYLEKLQDLYRELVEGEPGAFENEYDLFRKSVHFFDFMQQRITGRLDGALAHMRTHFRIRHGLDRDLYAEYMDKNLRYLEETLRRLGECYPIGLKRSRLRGREFLEELKKG